MFLVLSFAVKIYVNKQFVCWLNCLIVWWLERLLVKIPGWLVALRLFLPTGVIVKIAYFPIGLNDVDLSRHNLPVNSLLINYKKIICWRL
jgi:hypothetical protein